jgi:hypothetical protein
MIRWAGNVVQIERRGLHIGFQWERQKERDHQEGQDVGGSMLRLILEKQDELIKTGFIWLRIMYQWRALVNTVKKPSGSIPRWEILSSRATGRYSRKTKLHAVS